MLQRGLGPTRGYERDDVYFLFYTYNILAADVIVTCIKTKQCKEQVLAASFWRPSRGTRPPCGGMLSRNLSTKVTFAGHACRTFKCMVYCVLVNRYSGLTFASLLKVFIQSWYLFLIEMPSWICKSHCLFIHIIKQHPLCFTMNSQTTERILMVFSLINRVIDEKGLDR